MDAVIRQALGHPAPRPRADVGQKLAIAGCLVAGTVFYTLRYLLRSHYLTVPGYDLSAWVRAATGACDVCLVLLAGRLLDVFGLQRVRDVPARYNLKRLLTLVVGGINLAIVLSVLFANWTTAVVSLGVVSLLLSFSLQTPITSFIGWVYILVRTPYRVGDRIKIENCKGDVIDVSYLDTTLWEFGGDYITGDHPSGRVVKFPNSKVLNTSVTNYSWPAFPYIWNEIKFQIAYNSDLDYVAETMQRIAEAEVGEEMMERVRLYRGVLAETPVDHLEVRERPVVSFRVDDNTWLVARVRYPVLPRESGAVKSRLLVRMLAALNESPDKVGFPKGDSR